MTEDERTALELRTEFEARMFLKFLWFPRRRGLGYRSRRIDRRWRDFQAGAAIGARIEQDRRRRELQGTFQ
jgi:hypothetical protein